MIFKKIIQKKNLCAISSPLSFNISLTKHEIRLTASDISSYLENNLIIEFRLHSLIKPKMKIVNVSFTKMICSTFQIHKKNHTMTNTFENHCYQALKYQFVDCLGHNYTIILELQKYQEVITQICTNCLLFDLLNFIIKTHHAQPLHSILPLKRKKKQPLIKLQNSLHIKPLDHFYYIAESWPFFDYLELQPLLIITYYTSSQKTQPKNWLIH